jgi:hypothetical protein
LSVLTRTIPILESASNANIIMKEKSTIEIDTSARVNPFLNVEVRNLMSGNTGYE